MLIGREEEGREEERCHNIGGQEELHTSGPATCWKSKR